MSTQFHSISVQSDALMRDKLDTRKKRFLETLTAEGTVCMPHKPQEKFRDRLNINIEQVQSEIDEMMGRFREHPGLLNLQQNDVKRMKIIDRSYDALLCCVGEPLKQGWADV